MDKKMLELYSDFLVASTSLTTATAFSKEDKLQERFIPLSQINSQSDEAIPALIKGLNIPLIQTIQHFENEDGSSDTLYLISNDIALNFDDIIDFYYEQWKIEGHHKSMKQNFSVKKSPAKIVMTRSNHIFTSVYAYVKLKLLRVKTSLNHFTLKSKILLHNHVDIRLAGA